MRRRVLDQGDCNSPRAGVMLAAARAAAQGEHLTKSSRKSAGSRFSRCPGFSASNPSELMPGEVEALKAADEHCRLPQKFVASTLASTLK